MFIHLTALLCLPVILWDGKYRKCEFIRPNGSAMFCEYFQPICDDGCPAREDRGTFPTRFLLLSDATMVQGAGGKEFSHRPFSLPGDGPPYILYREKYRVVAGDWNFNLTLCHRSVHYFVSISLTLFIQLFDLSLPSPIPYLSHYSFSRFCSSS